LVKDQFDGSTVVEGRKDLNDFLVRTIESDKRIPKVASNRGESERILDGIRSLKSTITRYQRPETF